MARTAGATAAGTTEKLLRAAADVFGARGYNGTRVSDIARAAGLSNGALYAYFGSRQRRWWGGWRGTGAGAWRPAPSPRSWGQGSAAGGGAAGARAPAAVRPGGRGTGPVDHRPA